MRRQARHIRTDGKTVLLRANRRHEVVRQVEQVRHAKPR